MFKMSCPIHFLFLVTTKHARLILRKSIRYFQKPFTISAWVLLLGMVISTEVYYEHELHWGTSFLTRVESLNEYCVLIQIHPKLLTAELLFYQKDKKESFDEIHHCHLRKVKWRNMTQNNLYHINRYMHAHEQRYLLTWYMWQTWENSQRGKVCDLYFVKIQKHIDLRIHINT